MNPGKIVHPPAMDDRRLFRYGPDYAVPEFKTALDWSAWPGAGGRISRCRRDVQQQRGLPQAEGRGDVPVLPRHPAWSGMRRAAGPTRCALRSAGRCPAG